MPEIGLSDAIKMKFLEMWANNGDIISKQYAGTNALKVASSFAILFLCREG